MNEYQLRASLDRLQRCVAELEKRVRWLEAQVTTPRPKCPDPAVLPTQPYSATGWDVV